MKVKIEKSIIHGSVKAPPSKSMLHRLLILAGLTEGRSEIANAAESQDILATIDCLKAIGCTVERSGNSFFVSGSGGLMGGSSTRRAIGGNALTGISPIPPVFPCRESGSTLPRPNNENISIPSVFPCRESGSTLRFFLPIALSISGGGIFTGTKRLFERGIDVYVDVLGKKGIVFKENDCGIEVSGRLSPGKYEIPGNVSSQYISGLLFALPLLKGDSTLCILPPIESRQYIDLTLSLLKRAGIIIEEKPKNTFMIRGAQRYACTYATAEGDWSNAAFLYALKALGNDITITGLNMLSLQGDKACIELFQKLDRYKGYAKNDMNMGIYTNVDTDNDMNIYANNYTNVDTYNHPNIDINNYMNNDINIDIDIIDIKECIDLGPILFAYAAARHGAKFTGTARLKIKECDRQEAMAAELAKFGIRVDTFENSAVVYDGRLHSPAVPLDGHNDHRIVMALSVLLTLTGGEINGAEAVRKSYPAFFDDLRSLSVRLETDGN